MSRFDLSGKVVMVTGGARGIGLGTARAAARRGARVVIVDLREDDAEGVAREFGDRGLGIGADVTDFEAMEAAVAQAVERFGGVDVVVANAGIGARGSTARAADPEAFERVLDVNLYGVWRTVRAALPQIVERRGHVVVVASIYAFWNGVGAVSYAMAKAGVESLGRSLRVELQPRGAGCSVAYFGFIDTELVKRAIDADPLADRMFEAMPKPLRKRLPPSVAGEGIVRGIESRKPRIILPRRWAVMSALRGILNPLIDTRMTKDQEVQAIVRALDARDGEPTFTTEPERETAEPRSS